MWKDYASGHSAAFSALKATHFGSASAFVADGFLRAFRNAYAAVNASIRIYNHLAVTFTEAETGQTSTQDLHLMQESFTTETINLTPR